MQKAIIISHDNFNNGEFSGEHFSVELAELNHHLEKGWRFVSASPFGCSITANKHHDIKMSAMLVIIEKLP